MKGVRIASALAGLLWLLAGCGAGVDEPATDATTDSAADPVAESAPAPATSQAPAADTALDRASFVASLFTGAEQYQAFDRLERIFPVHRIRAADVPHRFPRGAEITLPDSYRYDGADRSVTDFLEETRTVALLVIRDGEIRHERYWLTGGEDVTWMSMSVGKSFVSALVGIAVDDGLITSIEQPITDYVPELQGSAYDGVRIKDVLQMSSGARWNEDYSDPNSDIARYGAVMGSGASLDAFTASLVRERPPGTFNYYNSTDTQALGMLLVRATGMTMAAWAEQELWQPLGMAHDAYWITDDSGMEMAAGGLQVTARDYARLGQLYLQGGRWGDRQIISEAWVRDSLTADAPHLLPSAHPEFPVGYGYQWWLPEGDRGEFSAIGVYNQFVFVDPERRVVIVKLSANPNYGLTNDESSYRELESFELFRAIIADSSW